MTDFFLYFSVLNFAFSKSFSASSALCRQSDVLLNTVGLIPTSLCKNSLCDPGLGEFNHFIYWSTQLLFTYLSLKSWVYVMSKFHSPVYSLDMKYPKYSELVNLIQDSGLGTLFISSSYILSIPISRALSNDSLSNTNLEPFRVLALHW